MSQQKALLIEKKNGPFVVGTRAVPTPGAGDLLVKVHAAGLNPVDWKIQVYGIFVETFPAVLGTDGAGEVVDVGEGVEGWSKGDKVFFQGYYANSDLTTFQQYTLIPAELAAKIPDGISYSQAATIPVAHSAAVIGLWGPKPIGAGIEPSFDGKPHYTGEPTLVIGGSASAGQYAIQLLKLNGFSPIIAYASSRHADHLKSLGATDVIDRNSTPFSDLPSAIQKITKAPFTKVVFDAVGGADAQQAGYDLLSSGGTLVTLLTPEVKNPSEDKRIFQVYGVGHPPTHREFGKVVFKNLGKLVADGAIVPNRFEDLSGGLGGIVGGLERLQKSQVSGVKLVAHPQE